MKKVLALVLVLVLSLSVFAACGKKVDWSTYLSYEDYNNENWDKKPISYQFLKANQSDGNGPMVVNLYKDGSVVAWEGDIIAEPVAGYKPEDIVLVYPEYKIFGETRGYWVEENGKITVNVFVWEDDEEYTQCVVELDKNGAGTMPTFPNRSCVVHYVLTVDVVSDGTVHYKNRAEFYDSFKHLWEK